MCRCVSPTSSFSDVKKGVVSESMVAGEGKAASAEVKQTTVVKWPKTYLVQHPLPEAGTPCSPIDLPIGAEVKRHIQVFREGANARRCVSNTLPIYAQ